VRALRQRGNRIKYNSWYNGQLDSKQLLKEKQETLQRDEEKEFTEEEQKKIMEAFEESKGGRH